jgi:competence protein ComEA
MKTLNTLWKVVFVTALLVGASFVNAAPVNVNTADAKTLAQNINGIGPKKAQAIVNYRTQNGPFKSSQELTKVKGIGQKIIEKNKDDLLFSDASSSKAKKSAKN